MPPAVPRGTPCSARAGSRVPTGRTSGRPRTPAARSQAGCGRRAPERREMPGSGARCSSFSSLSRSCSSIKYSVSRIPSLADVYRPEATFERTSSFSLGGRLPSSGPVHPQRARREIAQWPLPDRTQFSAGQRLPRFSEGATMPSVCTQRLATNRLTSLRLNLSGRRLGSYHPTDPVSGVHFNALLALCE